MAFVSPRFEYISNATAVFSGWTNRSNIDDAVLNVAIVDQPSCQSAKKNNASYACSNGSSCQNSSSDGYLCDCSYYEQGNPYILDGCMQGVHPALLFFSSPT
jgi:hypothetical protein